MSKLILVSAGHTNNKGQDRGVGAHGLVEGIEAVRVRDTVAMYLREKGLVVLEDGPDGVNDALAKAIVLAKKVGIAVEIHFNAAANPKATGIEVLSKPRSKALARKLAGAIHSPTKLPLRGGDGGYKADNSGQHHRLAFCEAGGLIVELCFLTNPSDVDTYQENFEAISRGLAEVLAAAAAA